MSEMSIPFRSPVRPSTPFSLPARALQHKPTLTIKPINWKSTASNLSSVAVPSNSTSGSLNQTIDGQWVRTIEENDSRKKRVFFLDINPLCYAGTRPSLTSFSHWVSLFLSQVSRTDPVIAVLDGEGGSEYRRKILPSYKAHRIKFSRQPSTPIRPSRAVFRNSHRVITNVLQECNVPVIKIEGHEADDVIATLVEQALDRRYRVVIASPDKDFKQLISEDIQIVMPLTDLNRWSFYTLKHYLAQYKCDPRSDLSLRCILGDEVDGVPGIQHVVPGFGRKTAVKLLQKHGSLENLLNTAAVRTVGKQYAQDALVKYADFLRRNHEVLALRRDVDVQLQDGWLAERDMNNDSTIFSNFSELLERNHRSEHQNISNFPCG